MLTRFVTTLLWRTLAIVCLVLGLIGIFLPGLPTSGWVHCSFAINNRGQDLTKFKGSKTYYPGIILRPE